MPATIGAHLWLTTVKLQRFHPSVTTVESSVVVLLRTITKIVP